MKSILRIMDYLVCLKNTNYWVERSINLFNMLKKTGNQLATHNPQLESRNPQQF